MEEVEKEFLPRSHRITKIIAEIRKNKDKPFVLIEGKNRVITLYILELINRIDNAKRCLVSEVSKMLTEIDKEE